MTEVKNNSLRHRVEQTRLHTQSLVMHLSQEDQCVQSMPDASPCKWHLGHTTWFWEAVLLQPHATSYKVFDANFLYLFNSYYESLGPRQPRPQRGLLTRPALNEVLQYRAYVTQALLDWLEKIEGDVSEEIAYLIELGINHEQQHQELIVTDVLHLFSCHPFLPASQLNLKASQDLHEVTSVAQWLSFGEGLHDLGHGAAGEFSFDNEQPHHKRWLNSFQICSQLVTCAEYLEFIQDDGYKNSSLWLSEGWAWVNQTGANSPAYWLAPQSRLNPCGDWKIFDRHGISELNNTHAVTHLNFYEADAYAQWRGARLPTEFEWEVAFDAPDMHNMLGQAWQWTRSAYEPYPGFTPRNGAIREYNGKFMVGQQVLRGSSWATPVHHARKTYRNFFPPAATWQITGLRLAKDMK